MPKNESWRELYIRRGEQLDLLSMALHDALITTPDACETLHHQNNTLVARLYRSEGATGGYFILNQEWFSTAEERKLNNISVLYLEKTLESKNYPEPIKILAERLRVRRDNILRQK
jgi:hypothetical protein